MKQRAMRMSTGSSRKVADLDSTAVGKDVSLQVMVPLRIKREVSLRAAQEGATQRTVILRALKAIGFVVKDNELCDKRKQR
jgi:hypothetical protein